MTAIKNGPGGPCCCKCAGIFSEDYNRANSTTIGNGATETAGDWSISSNAVTVSSTNAKLSYGPTTPSGATGVQFLVDFKATTSGDKIRFYYDTTTSNNYVEVTIGSSGTGKIGIYANNVLLGSSTVEWITSTNTYYTLEVSVCATAEGDGVNICAKEHGSIITRFAAFSSIPVVTFSCALGTGGTLSSSATFDNLIITQTKASGGSCPKCVCSPCSIYSDWSVETSVDTTKWQNIDSLSVSGGYLVFPANKSIRSGNTSGVPTRDMSDSYYIEVVFQIANSGDSIVFGGSTSVNAGFRVKAGSPGYVWQIFSSSGSPHYDPDSGHVMAYDVDVAAGVDHTIQIWGGGNACANTGAAGNWWVALDGVDCLSGTNTPNQLYLIGHPDNTGNVLVKSAFVQKLKNTTNPSTFSYCPPVHPHSTSKHPDPIDCDIEVIVALNSYYSNTSNFTATGCSALAYDFSGTFSLSKQGLGGTYKNTSGTALNCVDLVYEGSISKTIRRSSSPNCAWNLDKIRVIGYGTGSGNLIPNFVCHFVDSGVDSTKAVIEIPLISVASGSTYGIMPIDNNQVTLTMGLFGQDTTFTGANFSGNTGNSIKIKKDCPPMWAAPRLQSLAKRQRPKDCGCKKAEPPAPITAKEVIKAKTSFDQKTQEYAVGISKQPSNVAVIPAPAREIKQISKADLDIQEEAMKKFRAYEAGLKKKW